VVHVEGEWKLHCQQRTNATNVKHPADKTAMLIEYRQLSKMAT
jgi:hypothetical protein